LPDFDELLEFGGGGSALWGCQPPEFPATSNAINVFGADGENIWLCVWLASANPAKPLRVTASYLDGTPINLESKNLLFDKNRDSVLWEDSYLGGAINNWTQSGSVFFTLILSWPASLPSGAWRVMILQQDGIQISKDFEVSRTRGKAYISALGQRSDREIMSGSPWMGTHLLRPNSNNHVDIYGVGYPPNTPVYLLLYLKHKLVQKQVVLSDPSGNVSASFSGPFELDKPYSKTYLLYGITDPNMKLDGVDLLTCHDVVASKPGAACDYFEILPEVMPPLATATYHAPYTCPGAPPQRMVINWRGYVCTRRESVHLRVDHMSSADVLASLLPGTQFTVVDGPSCSGNWSWWKIQLDNGMTGWVSEGGDESDAYFICPLE
jgi:hypothetical protein